MCVRRQTCFDVRQLFVISPKTFPGLAFDLAAARADIPTAAAPVLLYAMTCLEYSGFIFYWIMHFFVSRFT